MSDYDEIGEERLRAVIEAFVDRMFDDLMIGFFFRSASRERIKEMELQHAAEHLGGPVTYGGRPLDKAHAPHRIMGGHFERRKKILDDTLREHGVSEAIRERWMAHLETLRPLVTKDAGSECR